MKWYTGKIYSIQKKIKKLKNYKVSLKKRFGPDNKKLAYAFKLVTENFESEFLLQEVRNQCNY